MEFSLQWLMITIEPGSSETPVQTFQITQHLIPEDVDL
jgi:hypothetical protein